MLLIASAFTCNLLNTATDEIDYRLFFEAIRLRGRIHVVQNFLSNKSIDIENKDENGNTALNVASMYGRQKITRLLLERDANTEVKDEYGDTPLLGASYRGYKEVVSLLLERGANTEVKDKLGRTAIQIAQYRGYAEIVELIEYSLVDTKEPEGS